jgi:formylglycine-generating enzyme required for sulfatase activity
MPDKIFVSYRRDDDPNGAARIRDALTAKFGRSSVFMDVDDLLAGLRFDEELAKALAACDVFLSIIGPRWMDLLTAKAPSGDRDYVREEITEALRRKIVVIPVRVGREGQLPPLPRADELPPEIRALVHYQKHDVTYEHFRRDASALVDAITTVRRHVRPKTKVAPHVPWGWIGATAASVLAIGWVGAHQLGVTVWWPFAGDAKPVLEPSKDDLAAAAKNAVLKEQAAAAEKRRREEAEAKRKEEEQAKAEAERQRLAAAAAEQRRREEAEANRSRLAEEGRRRDAGKRDPVAALAPGSGKSARDRLADGSPCPFCPDMVVVPAGTFTMGSPENERLLIKNMERQPANEVSVLQDRVLRSITANFETQVRVSIAEPFAVGRFAVTFDQWDACVADGGCNGYKPDDKGWGRGEHPVINVNWDDAKSYIAWLSRKTGKTYRLLSEAEREYVTRAGTTTPFWWGTTITPKQANYNGNYVYPGGSKGEYRERTVPVGSFQSNPWGLYNVHGNVEEWTEDCWYADNKGNPGNGRARTSGDCTRATRGGSWHSEPEYLRSANRHSQSADYRGSVGFRLARVLSP